MKVEISSSIFNDFVKKSKVVSNNFGGILVDATENTVELIKCDIESQVTLEVCSHISEKGTVILPKEVFPLINSDSIMTILDDKVIVGSRIIKIKPNDAIEYPRIDGDFKNNVFELTDKEIKHLLEVEHAISQDLTKPILNGIRIMDNRFISIDGYRLCERTGNFKSDIPISISNYKMLKALRGNITATCNDKYIKYSVGDYNFYNRMLDGDFIEVDKLKPKEHSIVIEIFKDGLLEVLKSMSNICKDSKNQLVMMDICKNIIHITCKNEKLELKDSVICETIKHLDDLKMGFNCKYLLESIKNTDSKFKMSFTNTVNPVIIQSPGKYELILPVRVANV